MTTAFPAASILTVGLFMLYSITTLSSMQRFELTRADAERQIERELERQPRLKRRLSERVLCFPISSGDPDRSFLRLLEQAQLVNVETLSERLTNADGRKFDCKTLPAEVVQVRLSEAGRLQTSEWDPVGIGQWDIPIARRGLLRVTRADTDPDRTDHALVWFKWQWVIQNFVGSRGEMELEAATRSSLDTIVREVFGMEREEDGSATFVVDRVGGWTLVAPLHILFEGHR